MKETIIVKLEIYHEMERNPFEHFKFIIRSVNDLPTIADCISQDTYNDHITVGNSCILVIKTHLKSLTNETDECEPEKCLAEYWILKLANNKLMRHIIKTYKPHLYFKGCGALYGMQCGFIILENFNGIISDEFLARRIMRNVFPPQYVYSVELTITEYPNIIEGVIIEDKYLETEGGGTMDEAEIKFIFDSIRNAKSTPTTANISFTFVD